MIHNNLELSIFKLADLGIRTIEWVTVCSENSIEFINMPFDLGVLKEDKMENVTEITSYEDFNKIYSKLRTLYGSDAEIMAVEIKKNAESLCIAISKDTYVVDPSKYIEEYKDQIEDIVLIARDELLNTRESLHLDCILDEDEIKVTGVSKC